MDFLGIGPLELVFILIIALVIFGPDELVNVGKTIGEFLRNLVTSPGWKTFQETSQEIRNLPNRLMREAGIDELENEGKRIAPSQGNSGHPTRDSHEELDTWTTPPPSGLPPNAAPSVEEESDQEEGTT